MDLTLDPGQLELQARARAFVTDVLQPLEEEFERADGRLSRKQGSDLREAAIEARLQGGSLPREVGGQGWTVLEQVIVHEQLGQVTGGLWSYIPGAYNALVHATPEQRERYLDPSLRGERSGSYAVTEEAAGSDARTLAATATRDTATGDYILNGEKWFVTGPDDTDFMIFHCVVVDGDKRLPTLFLVDYDTPGVTLKHDPDYMHTFADRHPQFVLDDVRVPATAVLGGVGEADALTNEWFVEERIHIGARCSGAMERLLVAGGRVGHRPASSSANGSTTSRASRSRSPTRPPTRPRRGCSPARRPGSPTPARTRRSSTPRRRSPSCSPRRPRFGAPTASSRSSVAAATCANSRPSASSASCGSTGSGRAPRRSSG